MYDTGIPRVYKYGIPKLTYGDWWEYRREEKKKKRRKKIAKFFLSNDLS